VRSTVRWGLFAGLTLVLASTAVASRSSRVVLNLPAFAGLQGNSGTVAPSRIHQSHPSTASPEPFPTAERHWGCPQVRVPEIYPGYPSNGIGLQEIDLFGRHVPTCARADHLMRLVPTRIPKHRWGRMDGWRCVWVAAWEECKRSTTRVYASDPGD
jgi:hypothetical protein